MKNIGWILLVTGSLFLLFGLIEAIPAAGETVIYAPEPQTAPPVQPFEYAPFDSTVIPLQSVPFAKGPIFTPFLKVEPPAPVMPEPSSVFPGEDRILASQRIQAAALAAASSWGIPVRLQIPAISLDIPILAATERKVLYEGYVFDQWIPPKNAGGWQTDSALLGKKGNTVINGHNNEYGEVFRYLENVEPGDIVNVYSADGEFTYIVTNRIILLEAGEKSRTRLDNAGWIGETNDERITLVTCWPYDDNTHRLVIVASRVRAINER
jgi:LPXTG-site transpeptidase (sortase) family protein